MQYTEYCYNKTNRFLRKRFCYQPVFRPTAQNEFSLTF
ncbi:hypothetical protein M23134_00220 [Microscilla marina ATCC 23134]|uniref:Uncharacterized protein n=1 Tax=Microscilla marina ATCC 23134 TaxID=313606 RepID=A1ZNY8_MICM2|nr:hypothetical protein M23134_00220 [Microscilla marina ATCC 23134]